MEVREVKLLGDWYFDFLSPFAYLQLVRLTALPVKLAINYRPVLIGALMDHWGQMGPAEITPKREFTHRHVLWMAARHNIPLQLPRLHPFNPLKLLRLSIAADNRPDAVRRIFEFVWRDGHLPEDGEAMNALGEELGVPDWQAAIELPAVKDALRQSTAKAVGAGVFGVPTMVINGERFWGNDATEMLIDYCRNPSLFERREYDSARETHVGIVRRRAEDR